MKICWDMLEKVRLSKRGNLRIGSLVYIEMDSCKKCGEPYLTSKDKPSNFCSKSCAMGEENHPLYGKHHSEKTKRKISRVMSIYKGSLAHNYKGGIYTVGLAMYVTYKDQLKLYENIRERYNTGILEVKCVYCGRWYTPSYETVKCRLKAINGFIGKENRFYCSENCKQACPIYGRRKYPKGFKHTTSREVSTYLRQMVLKRDNWTCQICGKTVKECQLHVHHMDPVAQNPMFQNDMDSCITLCKGCHKMVHSRIGCRYVDLQCK